MNGREKELQHLRNLYQSDDFEYLVMYGRSVGKTMLLQKFSKEKNIIFSNYTNEQKLTNYGILGGIPRYFEASNPKNDIQNNIGKKQSEKDLICMKNLIIF